MSQTGKLYLSVSPETGANMLVWNEENISSYFLHVLCIQMDGNDENT
jgi:hypothetical protein